MSTSNVKCESPQIELRNGVPYANLVANQSRFSEFLGAIFGISPNDIIPMPGTTGAIEAVRNHILKNARSREPVILTVTPGYWRARESFQGMGFRVSDVKIEANGFAIHEAEMTARIMAEEPDLVYLSLPNNPTGALFNPEDIVTGAHERTAILFDLTLPSRDLDPVEISARLYHMFKGRKNLFLTGSTSKSHNTAESRIGWLICANSDDSRDLRNENRNVIASMSIQQGLDQVGKAPLVLEMIERSFSLLREAEQRGKLSIIRPQKRTGTAYVLVKVEGDVKGTLAEQGIRVMWGSEYGLSDEYMRLDTLEPEYVAAFIAAIYS